MQLCKNRWQSFRLWVWKRGDTKQPTVPVPQNSLLTAKPCLEEIAPSFLEVMSEDEAVVSEKTSIQLLPAEHRLPPPGAAGEPPAGEEYPGYVMLRKGTFIHCPKANTYIHIRGTHERERQPVHACTHDPGCDLLCSGQEFLNQSYVPQAEPADEFKCLIPAVRESRNLYTNLPCS